MKIDLTVLEDLGNHKEIDTKISFENLSFREREIQIPERLSLKLDIYKAETSFIFTGKLKGKLILECSRCLEPFPYELETDINKEIKIKDIEDLKIFEINPILKKDIFLSLPIKPLCSEDCKGLCPQCGQNLNQGECDCTTDNIDPRMAQLQKFYDEEENE